MTPVLAAAIEVWRTQWDPHDHGIELLVRSQGANVVLAYECFEVFFSQEDTTAHTHTSKTAASDERTR